MGNEDEPAATDVVRVDRRRVTPCWRRTCARRSAIGAITDLHAIASTLAFGDDVDAALGRRISALAASFDFDGLRELAASLESAQGSE